MPFAAEQRSVGGSPAVSLSFSITCGGAGKSGLPMPRSMMSAPALRAFALALFTSSNTYGGKLRTRENSSIGLNPEGFFLLAHDLTRKPVSIFRDHVPTALQPADATPVGFYHGFGLAPAVCPFSASLGGFLAVLAGFLADGGRPSWRSLTLARSFSSLTCSSSVMGTAVRSGGMS